MHHYHYHYSLLSSYKTLHQNRYQGINKQVKSHPSILILKLLTCARKTVSHLCIGSFLPSLLSFIYSFLSCFHFHLPSSFLRRRLVCPYTSIQHTHTHKNNNKHTLSYLKEDIKKQTRNLINTMPIPFLSQTNPSIPASSPKFSGS